MGQEAQSITPGRPQIGDLEIGIPLTFGYKGGRGRTFKNKIIAGIIGTIITLFVLYLIIVGESWWLYKLFWVIGIIIVYQFVIRFVVLEEHKFQKTYQELLKDDMVMDEKDFWGSYEIEEEYPYFISFSNGKRGLMVKMERDVIVGKSVEDEFGHYEAIGNALKKLARLDVSVALLDTMDSIGADTVLLENLAEAGNCQNKGVREALIDIFQNLQDQSKEKYTSEDTFVFASRDKDSYFLEAVQDFCAEIMEGNYKAYEFLDQDKIREEVKNIFNLEDFSVNEAIENLYGLDSEEVTSVKVISMQTEDGEEIRVTKSQKEIAKEAEERTEKAIVQRKLAEERKLREVEKKIKEKEEKEREKLIRVGKISEIGVGEKKEITDEELDLF